MGDVKVENVIVTFYEEEDEHTLAEEGSQIERGTVFHRYTRQREIYSRNICDKRLLREACFDLGDVKVEKDIVTFNEKEDEVTLVEEGSQIERARCFPGTHATVRLTQKAFVTSGSRVKRFLTWVMSKWRTSLLPFMIRRKKTLSWERIQIERGTVFLRDTCHREI